MSDPHLETVRVARAGGIVTITLARPERKNAIDGRMWDELLATFRAIADSPSDRVVVLTGEGDAFCSGADLVAGGEPRHGLASMHHINEVCLALHRLPQPTIAKVNGVAAGAGCNLALGADLVVASRTARFSEIFSRRALSVDFGGTWLLPRIVGRHKAMELALLADIIDATEAERIGLVNKVVDPDQLDAAVDEWATRLAAGPPIALAQTKRMIDDSYGATFDEALEAEARSQTINFVTADTSEAIAAFVQKRDPKFTGR